MNIRTMIVGERMSSNLTNSKVIQIVKQDINRRKPSDVNGKEGKRLSKRIDDITKVISDASSMYGMLI